MNMERAVVPLPALTPRVRYQGIPRRYEETKPVLVRDLTHRKILDLGLNVHQKTLDLCSEEKAVAIRVAEEAVWEKAETIKQVALQKAQELAQKDHEKVVRKLNKAQERAVKEEKLRMQGVMEMMIRQEVQLEKEAGERRLAAAVAATEARCLQEKLAAITEARQEEQDIAAEKAAAVAQVEAEKLAAAIQKAADEKAVALQLLETRKDLERIQAVQEVREAEQDIATSKLAHMQRSYEDKIVELRKHIDDLRITISGLQDELTQVKTHRKCIVEELVETRAKYQAFINMTDPFEKGKSDYVIPPIRSVDLSNFE